MPTAVGPNTKGEENLVFGYDLGDVSNSYRGEPTVNYAPNPLFDSVSGYGNFGFGHNNTIETSTIPGALQGTAARIVKNTSTSGTIVGAGGTPVLSNGDKITVTYYVKGVGPSIGQEVHIHCYVNSSTGAISTGTTYPGAATSNWKRFSHTFTWTKDNTSYGGAYGYCRVPFSTGTEFLVSNPQIEINGHATPFVDGTRSATQGLLDLTGNSTIDLSNVSFDSNAQKTFDGTDDYALIDSVPTSIANLTQGTIEIVFKWGGTANRANIFWIGDNTEPTLEGQFYIWIGNSTGASNAEGIRVLFRNASNTTLWDKYEAMNSSTHFRDSKYHHLVIVQDGIAPKIYVDSVDITTNLINWTTPSNEGAFFSAINCTKMVLGHQYYGGSLTGGTALDGEIPAFKIYNRALTSSEVKSNYNAIKGRFNI